jgi:hypothetical protein
MDAPRTRSREELAQALLDYGSKSLDGIGRGARAVSSYVDPFQYVTPESIAGFLPGGGIVQGNQDMRGAWDEYQHGNYGQAGLLGAQGVVNSALDVLPLTAALPTISAMKPRTFYRGTNPGDTRRISTGNEAWDGHLFASADPESAKMYGSHLTKLEAAPDAKILYEGTGEFVNVAGRWRKGESLLDYSSRAAEAAKAAGYDAVHFKRQGDVGTAILNPSKFSKE